MSPAARTRKPSVEATPHDDGDESCPCRVCTGVAKQMRKHEAEIRAKARARIETGAPPESTCPLCTYGDDDYCLCGGQGALVLDACPTCRGGLSGRRRRQRRRLLRVYGGRGDPRGSARDRSACGTARPGAAMSAPARTRNRRMAPTPPAAGSHPCPSDPSGTDVGERTGHHFEQRREGDDGDQRDHSRYTRGIGARRARPV